MRNLGDIDWVWQFGLYPVDEKRTLLVSRSRVHARTVWAWLLTTVIEPAGFVMTRRMLLGLKQRAEALATAGDDRAAHAASGSGAAPSGMQQGRPPLRANGIPALTEHDDKPPVCSLLQRSRVAKRWSPGIARAIKFEDFSSFVHVISHRQVWSSWLRF